MSSSSAAPVSGQSPPVDSSSDIQRNFIAKRLWPIEMDPTGQHPKTELKIYFLDPHNENKMQAVCHTVMSNSKRSAEMKFAWAVKVGLGKSPIRPLNPWAFDTWEQFGNLHFQRTERREEAHIRITFEGRGNSTVFGKPEPEDGDFPNDTMNLAGIQDKYPPDPQDRRTILHMFGHALGLLHEHEGPHTEQLVKLNVGRIEEVPFINDKYINYVDPGSVVAVRKRTNFNRTSIMVYENPNEWQMQPNKTSVTLSVDLSMHDKACAVMMYPPDLRDPTNHSRVLSALCAAGVDHITAAEIMQEYTRVVGGSEAERLTRLRDRFCKWYQGTIVGRDSDGNLISRRRGMFTHWYDAKYGALRGINPAASLRQSGINHFIGEVTKDKLFQGIVKNIVYRSVVQQGIPTKVSVPGAMPTEATKLVAALSAHGEVGRLVAQCRGILSGDKDDHEGKATNSTIVTPTQNIALSG